MIVERIWFCTCTGKPCELVAVAGEEDEVTEPACPRCGASASNDPKHTVGYRDEVRPKIR